MMIGRVPYSLLALTLFYCCVSLCLTTVVVADGATDDDVQVKLSCMETAIQSCKKAAVHPHSKRSPLNTKLYAEEASAGATGANGPAFESHGAALSDTLDTPETQRTVVTGSALAESKHNHPVSPKRQTSSQPVVSCSPGGNCVSCVLNTTTNKMNCTAVVPLVLDEQTADSVSVEGSGKSNSAGCGTGDHSTQDCGTRHAAFSPESGGSHSPSTKPTEVKETDSACRCGGTNGGSSSCAPCAPAVPGSPPIRDEAAGENGDNTAGHNAAAAVGGGVPYFPPQNPEAPAQGVVPPAGAQVSSSSNVPAFSGTHGDGRADRGWVPGAARDDRVHPNDTSNRSASGSQTLGAQSVENAESQEKSDSPGGERGGNSSISVRKIKPANDDGVPNSVNTSAVSPSVTPKTSQMNKTKTAAGSTNIPQKTRNEWKDSSAIITEWWVRTLLPFVLSLLMIPLA